MEELNITHINGSAKHRIDQYRSVKIQPETIDLNMRLWGTNHVYQLCRSSQSLVLRSSCCRLLFNISKLVY